MIAFLRNLVFHDFWLKLFSLALATLIWLLVAPAAHKQLSPSVPLITHGSERTLPNVPLQVVASAADVRAYGVDPKLVEVTVQGDPKLVAELQAKDIRAFVDLTGIESAPRGLRKRVEVTTPAGITYAHINPAEVEVRVPAK